MELINKDTPQVKEFISSLNSMLDGIESVSYTHLAFLTILNEKTIGTDIYNEVFKFIVRGIVQQLFKD